MHPYLIFRTVPLDSMKSANASQVSRYFLTVLLAGTHSMLPLLMSSVPSFASLDRTLNSTSLERTNFCGMANETSCLATDAP